MKKCGTCGIMALIGRLAAAGILLWKGLPKLQASEGQIDFVSSAGPAMLETFGLNIELFSSSTWFWLAVTAELLAAVLLLFGYKARLGAVLALIVMAFILNLNGMAFFSDWPALIITIGALIVLFKGAGMWSVDKKKHCGSCKHDEDNDGEKAAKPSPKKEVDSEDTEEEDRELFHAEAGNETPEENNQMPEGDSETPEGDSKENDKK